METKTNETQTRVLDAAMQLFAQKGYQATSVSDVMHAAKASKSQFYYYFPAKKDLLLAVISEHFTEWDDGCFTGILENEADPVKALNDMLDWIYQAHEHQMTYYGCPVGNLIMELAAQDEDARHDLADFYGRWTDLLTDKFTALGADKPRIAAQQLIAGIQGSLLLLKLSQDLTVLKENFDALRTNIEQMKVKSAT